MEIKPKLQVDSKVDKFALYFRYAVFLTFVMYLLTIFYESPILISIILLILLAFLVLLTYNQIKVYTDKIEIIEKSFFLFNTSIKTFYFNQINSIESSLRIRGKKGTLIQLIGIFRASVNLISWNEYTIILSDGKRKSFSTRIEREDLIRVFQLVKRLSGNKIKVTGVDAKNALL